MKKKIRQKTCLASARISTIKQTSGESLDRQVEIIERFAQEKNIKILPDGKVAKEIHTAKKVRPVYQEHLKYIKNNPNKIDYYIITEIDRFTRGGSNTYYKMKEELFNLGVSLIDTNEIIKPRQNMRELEELGFEYEWSVTSPSEDTERQLAEDGLKEGRKILQRTIPKQIKYTQQGYHIGRPDDGYISIRIDVGAQKRYVLRPDPARAHFIIKIFELRASNKYSDHEIVKIMNNQYQYHSKKFKRWNSKHTEVIGIGGDKPLTFKQVHRIVKRPAYAGFICEKWTNNKPVKAQWDGLVSIELFNQANRGNVHLQKMNANEYGILYNHHPIRKVYKRRKYNPKYPYKFIKCPICNSRLKGSTSRGRNGKLYPRYHCARGHKNFYVRPDEMEKHFHDFMFGLKLSENYIDILKEGLKHRINEKNVELQSKRYTRFQEIKHYKEQEKRVLNEFLNSTNENLKRLLESKIEEISNKLIRLETTEAESQIDMSKIDEILKYAEKIVTHPQKLLIDKANPRRQESLMELVVEEIPTYDELVSHTPKLTFVFNGFNKKSTSKTSTFSRLG